MALEVLSDMHTYDIFAPPFSLAVERIHMVDMFRSLFENITEKYIFQVSQFMISISWPLHPPPPLVYLTSNI